MADKELTSYAQVTPTSDDLVLGAQNGQVKLFPASPTFAQQATTTATLVPYTGADSAVDLGANSLTAQGVTSTDNIALPKTSGKGIQVESAFGWRDLEGIINERPIGAGAPALTAFKGNVRGMAFALNDDYDLVYHMPHDWVPGSDLHIHVHWSHNDTAISGSLVFTYYVIYCDGHSQGAYGNEITITQTISTPNIATVPQYGHRLDEFQLTAGSPTAAQLDSDDLEPDGLIRIHFSLTTLPTLSGGSGKIFVDHVDIHYQSTNIGTAQKSPDFYA